MGTRELHVYSLVSVWLMRPCKSSCGRCVTEFNAHFCLFFSDPFWVAFRHFVAHIQNIGAFSHSTRLCRRSLCVLQIALRRLLAMCAPVHATDRENLTVRYVK